ncbi:MAG TPA: hypothetical protein PK358_10195 [Spirochaetota bacterium]|nr:hypothetical protein [Spirochaetota bacterium]
MKCYNFKIPALLLSFFIIGVILTIDSCITVTQPPEVPPLPDELKHIQFVNGWAVTRELEQDCKSVRMEHVSRSSDWWAIHRRAYELKTNVAQLVYDCSYNCDVRFWACGNKFLPDMKKEAVKLFGSMVGQISGISGKEITVTGKNINEKVSMGKILAVDAGEKMVYIEVTFPMMTLAKCRVVKGSLKNLKQGMKVYNKPKKK